MNECARCQYSIPAGQETWVRTRKSKQKVAICQNCKSEIQQKRSQKNGVKEKPVSRKSPDKAPDWLQPMTQSQPQNQVKTAAPPPLIKQASNPITLEGVLILLSLSMLAAPIFGAFIGFIAQWLYLIVLFPVGMGIVGGFIVGMGIHWGKLRSAAVAGFLGLLFGLVVYGSYRYTEYYFLRKEMISVISAELLLEVGEADPEIAALILDEILYDETGSAGFWGMIQLEAAEGMSISRARSPRNSFNVGSTLTQIYWFIEILIVLGVTAGVAVARTNKPFCEFHDRWYDKEESVGGILPAESKNITTLIKEGNFEQIGKLLKSDIPVPGFGLFLERCPDCQESRPHLTLKAFKRNSKGKTVDQVVLQTYIPLEDGIALQNNIATVGATE